MDIMCFWSYATQLCVLSSKNTKGKGYLFEDIVVMLWIDCRKPQKP